ncbi:uncharacterized protein SETTUDRAFT_168286 [Exserohilum turcica Et28A]|uniref:Enoyl reductase (ER) domain-containing protein n=1 Tax=Exserohilum turcicum (strain 28A) TaxID=671987 RepID=R0KK04_EXST2|nr:uncharacterized protein SETTUDRAFT_168286 [Exserohilum turcica Et28A]EOA88337.1 hypothetical protein SETTUDRAFT_168286 [Exserohilum turcica Et28A]
MGSKPTCEALICTAIGEVSIKTVPVQAIPDGYILIRTKAVALNPTDWKSIYAGDGGSIGTRPGIDFAGVVEEVGSGSKKSWNKGDRVFGGVWGAKDAESGAFGEYIIAKGDLLAEIPDELSFEDAATLAVGIMTCGQSLYQLLKLPLPTITPEDRPSSKKPRAIFIYGGSTASGIFGIQFAKLSGLVVLTTASPHNFEYLRSLGADAVFDYHDDVETLAGEIKKHTKGNLTIAWDCRPGPESGRLCALAMSDSEKGMYATLQPRTPHDHLHGTNPMVDTYFTIGYTVFGEPFTRAGRRYEARPEDAAFAKDFWEFGQDLVAAGKVKIPRLEINRGGSGLKGVIQGLETLRLGQVSSKKLVYTL